MNVSRLDPELEQVAVTAPLGREHVPLEPHVLGLRGSERGEVVRSHEEPPRTARSDADVERLRPPQRAIAQERTRRRPRQHAIAVGPRPRIPPRIKALRRPLDSDDRHVVRQDAVQRPQQPASLGTSSSQEKLTTWPRA